MIEIGVVMWATCDILWVDCVFTEGETEERVFLIVTRGKETLQKFWKWTVGKIVC